MKRDYNQEIEDNKERKYAYNFDFDIMHAYMIKSFLPFVKSGGVLELGSFQGDFTKRLLEVFDEITCIEASSVAIKNAQNSLKNKGIEFINSRFEDTKLESKYNNIVLTHVLEHVDDRVGLLKKINNEWLSNDGVLLLVCPNAHAPSRRIAVKMGLISHCEAVTDAEKAHGHQVTYTLETLRNDIKQSGLEIEHESGIFFKPFANYQWDKILNTDIITSEYIEGCFQLGREFPDLCSSIFFVCKKGF